jgi:hypothetical protein
LTNEPKGIIINVSNEREVLEMRKVIYQIMEGKKVVKETTSYAEAKNKPHKIKMVDVK